MKQFSFLPERSDLKSGNIPEDTSLRSQCQCQKCIEWLTCKKTVLRTIPAKEGRLRWSPIITLLTSLWVFLPQSISKEAFDGAVEVDSLLFVKERIAHKDEILNIESNNAMLMCKIAQCLRVCIITLMKVLHCRIYCQKWLFWLQWLSKSLSPVSSFISEHTIIPICTLYIVQVIDIIATKKWSKQNAEELQ